MPLLFVRLCDLLSNLEKISKHDPPLLPARYQQECRQIITEWFASHKISLHDTLVDPTVLLSSLLPAKRTDRVYNIRIPRISNILKRCLGLGVSRQKQLDHWQQPGRGDIGECVERVLQQAEFAKPPEGKQVTVQHVDNAFASIASRSRFSAPKVQRVSTADDDAKVLDTLTHIYQKLQSREAKWFTRLILKDFSCIELEKYCNLLYSHIDPRLPVAMQMYDDFEAAVSQLRSLPASQMADASHGNVTRQCAGDVRLLSPRVGVKVGPAKWIKAKGGVKHAVSIIDGRKWSIERKHDGEYCQIHLDLGKGDDCIQIFSKSGKDSTLDRKGIHSVIKEGLRIGRDDCKFSEKCILEGEMLVWSDETNDVLEFHKIRKHVSRSGSVLGTKEDSQPHPHEHLMIMLYDVLLIDDFPILHLPYSQRRQQLRRLIKPMQGRIGVVAQIDVTLSQSTAARKLRKYLAQAFVRRWEGLVLKPVDEPYFSLRRGNVGYPSQWIKLKKDCIRGLGDTADFAIVGAGYDSKRAIQLGNPRLTWTHFFLGCLKNKHAVLHMNAKPEYLIVDCVTNCIKKDDFRTLNQHGKFVALDIKDPQVENVLELDFVSIDPKLPRLQTVFKKPFVFDIAGSGFDKAPNSKIFTLRFPRVLKIRWDRSWKDAVDLPELQAMAYEARTPPTQNLEDEVSEWVEKLDRIDHGSKGGMASWDVTDEEESSHEPVVDTPTTNIKTDRRSWVQHPPPLIRMDTQEMHKGERRMSNGQVTERPTSNHSVTSDMSLPTPPTSSPSSKAAEGMYTRARGGLGMTVSLLNKRKWTAQHALANEESRSSKRARTEIVQHLSPTTVIVASTEKGGPLQETTNSARPSASCQSREPGADKQAQVEDFNIVRKIAVDAHSHISHRQRKLTKEDLPSSPGRQTTADECSATATTQHTFSSIATSKSITSPHETPLKTASLPTPLSTADPPPRVDVPDLTRSTVILGSSFDTHMLRAGPHLDKTNIKPIPFSEIFQTPGVPTLKPEQQASNGIVLLIRLTNTKATTNDLVTVATQYQTWRPRQISLWDHDLLSTLIHDRRRELSEQDLVKKFFYARIWWAGDGDDPLPSMKIHWRSGDIDSVSERDIECLRRMK